MPKAKAKRALEACAVCGVGEAIPMARAVIEGRVLCLCADHATTVAAARPSSIEALRDLFVGAAPDSGALLRLDAMLERRSPVPRRAPEDRRAFPPRPEGRRLGFGRRASDPRD